ncbi:MAG: hypothetical protein RL522_1430 [Pseudomonadota bacterium]|jgi:pimeloyl-ACP methyl ester carboxylesterase
MKDVVLLVPGMLNDERVWTDVRAAIEGEAEVRIASTAGQSTLTQMADAAWAMLADVPEGAHVVLAGFSMGGYVALQMLAQPRRALQGLALISTSGRPETPEASATRDKTLAAMQADFPKVVEGILKWSTYSATPAVTDRLRQMMLDLGLPAATAHTRAIQSRADRREVLQALRLPVHVLCGAHDRVTPPELAQELSGWIPGAKLQIIEDCGHMLPAEKPEVVAQALRALLA